MSQNPLFLIGVTLLNMMKNRHVLWACLTQHFDSKYGVQLTRPKKHGGAAQVGKYGKEESPYFLIWSTKQI